MAKEKLLLLRIKADVSQLISSAGEAHEAIDGLATGAQGSMGKLGDAVGSARDAFKSMLGEAQEVVALFSKAEDLANFAGEFERLSNNARDVDGLTKATHGLVDQMDLMRVGAKSAVGQFALTDEQLEQVAHAAISLHERGFGPVNEILGNLTEALTTGRTRGLIPYHISVTQATGEVAKLSDAMGQIADLAAKDSGEIKNVGDQTESSLHDLKGDLEEAKAGIGEMLGGLLQLFAKVYEALKALSGADAWDGLRDQFKKAQDQLRSYQEMVHGVDDANRTMAEREMARRHGVADSWDETNKQINDARERQLKDSLEAGNREFEQIKRDNERDARAYEERARQIAETELELDRDLFDAREKASADFRAMFSPDKLFSVADSLVVQHRVGDMFRGIAGELAGKGGLADMLKLGEMKVDPFVHLRDSAKIYEGEVKSLMGAFNQLGSAGMKAFEMLLTGQRGAGAAAAQAARQFLASEAEKNAGMALESLAWAAFDLFHNPAAVPSDLSAAATFGAFAAAYGAGSAIAGSPDAGGGASASAAGGGGGGQGLAARNTTQQTTSTTNIYLGSGFVVGTVPQLARMLQPILQDGAASGATSAATRGARRLG